MLNPRFTLLSIISLLLLTPMTGVFGQDTDSYTDYSHLWEKQPKKKKLKKSAQVTPIDSFVTLADSLESSQTGSVPADFFGAGESIENPKKNESTSSDDLQVDDFRSGMEALGHGGSFTGGFTYTEIGDEAFVGLVLSPEFKIGKVGVGLNIPLLYGLDSKSIRTEIFEDGVGSARLIRYIRYGVQKKNPIYVKVGELQGTMIGYGGLINNYTNSTSYEKRKTGLHYDLNYKGLAGIEGLYSDFDPASFNLFAIRPYLRPLSPTSIPIVRTFEIGAVIVKDKDQTGILTSDSTSTSYVFTAAGIGAFGVDMGVTLLRIPFIQIDLFANYSELDVDSNTLRRAATLITSDSNFSGGSGFSAGLNFRMHFIPDVFSTDVRIERLTYKAHYIPQFFDASYEINKDQRLLSLAVAPKMSGIYGSLTGHVLQKIELGGSLLIPDDITDTSPAVVQVRANMDRLADKYSLHGSYIKRNLTDLGDAFKFDKRSLAKMRFIYHMNSFLAMGLDYYWTFTPVADGSYKATKYVMPYIGVSIDF